MILYIIGTKGSAPIKSQNIKKFTQCRIVSNKNNITIDAGNVFKHPADLVLITHLHKDHIEKFHTIPQGTLVWAPDKSFIPILRKKNPRVKLNLINPNRTVKYKKFAITPFEVQHSKTARTFGYRINADNKNIVWVPDFKNLFGTSKFLKNLDYLFIGASSLNKDIASSKGELKGQQALTNTMEWLKMQKILPGKIYSIHHGQDLIPLKVKMEFVQKSFPGYNVSSTFDGQLIRL